MERFGNHHSLVRRRPPGPRQDPPARGRNPKYGEAFRDRPAIYPAPSQVKPGKPVVICEGEFDALLLGQEIGDLVQVITLGSASNKPAGPVLDLMLTAPIWYLALDADQAGDKSAADWPARARRVRPPAPHKDWGEVHAAGFNLIRYVWCGILKWPRHSMGDSRETTVGTEMTQITSDIHSAANAVKRREFVETRKPGSVLGSSSQNRGSEPWPTNYPKSSTRSVRKISTI